MAPPLALRCGCVTALHLWPAYSAKQRRTVLPLTLTGPGRSTRLLKHQARARRVAV
jgi:hypothetical protein